MMASNKYTVTSRDIEMHCDNPKALLQNLARGSWRHLDRISIGDIAHAGGANAALQCSLALDWDDGDLRRTMIGILVGWIRRCYPRMDDAGVIADLKALGDWAEGNGEIQLRQQSQALLSDVTGMPAEPQRTSDETAIAQIWQLMDAALQPSSPASKWTNRGAASVAMVGSELIAEARPDVRERQRQIDDIARAFP